MRPRLKHPPKASTKGHERQRRATKPDGSAAWAGPPRERGRPARMLFRCVPLSFSAMGHPVTLPARTAWARPKQSRGRRCPPGSAGVPPACYSVACRSVSPRWGTRSRCQPEPHGPDRSRVVGGGAPPGARASRPPAIPCRAAQFPRDGALVPPAGEKRMGPAEAEPWRLCRSSRVEEMGEAMPGCVRAGRPRSRVDFIFPIEGSGAVCPAVPGSSGYARRTGRGKRLPSRP